MGAAEVGAPLLFYATSRRSVKVLRHLYGFPQAAVSHECPSQRHVRRTQTQETGAEGVSYDAAQRDQVVVVTANHRWHSVKIVYTKSCSHPDSHIFQSNHQSYGMSKCHFLKICLYKNDRWWGFVTVSDYFWTRWLVSTPIWLQTLKNKSLLNSCISTTITISILFGHQCITQVVWSWPFCP